MNTILKAGAVACGLIAAGCTSRMTALNSELPSSGTGDLNGNYVLEGVKVSVEALDAASVSKAISTAGKDIFKGSAGNRQSLPVTISVEREKVDANGGIASVNNLFALCTLTLWPWVSADEYTYRVKARSVVGEHEVSFKVIDRCWGGLSPFAIIPVPGWADERGDESELVKFHIAQIAAGAKEACASLPNDYQTFLKDQFKYLEEIDKERSEAAFASFMATKQISALDGLTNEVVKKNHQNDLVMEFKNSDSAEARAAILKKLNDDSFQKLPYDPALASYWKKIENSRVLALIYRDNFASLAAGDRISLLDKISDDKVLAEMVVKPSEVELEKERRELGEKENKLRRQMEEAKRDAESAAKSAEQYKKDWKFGEAKEAEMEVVRCRQTYAMCAQGLTTLKSAVSKRLYVEDAHARKLLYGKIKNPETVVAVFGSADVAKESDEADCQTLKGAYGSTVDLRPEAARKYLAQVKNQDALIALAHGAKLFSIRAAAIVRVEDENELAKIARGEIEDCPYDTSLSDYSLVDKGFEWNSKTVDASKANLQKLAIAKMKDAKCLRDVRKRCKSEIVKKTVTARLTEIGQSDVAEICAYGKYDSDLFSMVEGLEKEADIQKVSQSAKLKGVRILAGSKLGADAFAAVAKKEIGETSVKPAKGKLVIAGCFLGMNIEDMFAKLAAEHPEVEPTIHLLDDDVLCLAGSNGRDIAWANSESLNVVWFALPPSVVKQMTGFKSGSVKDLKRAVERQLGLSFGYDVIRKGSVRQQIGYFENTEGETLRYFVGEIEAGEDIGRSLRKSDNLHTIGTDPVYGGLAALANVLEDAKQADENRANAHHLMFQPQGSLQLLLTEHAAKLKKLGD